MTDDRAPSRTDAAHAEDARASASHDAGDAHGRATRRCRDDDHGHAERRAGTDRLARMWTAVAGRPDAECVALAGFWIALIGSAPPRRRLLVESRQRRLEEADGLSVGVDVDLLAGRPGRQPGHRQHVAAVGGHETRAGEQARVADRHAEASSGGP